jgi:hypothetical protein
VAGTETGHKKNQVGRQTTNCICKAPLLPSIGLVARVQSLQPLDPPPPPSDPLAVKYALNLQSQFLGNKILLYNNAL